MVPIVYHPAYNVSAFGLERLHPFDGRKYRRIHDALIARGLRRKGDFVRPVPVTRGDLERVHTAEYLRTLRSPAALARTLEVPAVRRLPAWLVDWRVLRPMRYAAGGTVLAARLALERGLAVNLGGGYHHAAPSFGGGFCAYADAPLAAQTLYDEGKVGRVLVVDLDAHQGDGTAAFARTRPWASVLDLYEDDLFPGRKEPEDFPRPLPPGMTGPEYLEVVREGLAAALAGPPPDLIVYNAGSDPYVHDPLTRSRLSRRDLAERDLFVVTAARERSIPVVMILSGGYATDSWIIHTDAVEDILTRFDRT